MNRVHSHGANKRHNQWRNNKDDGHGFEEHAKNEQDNKNQSHKDVLVGGNAHEEGKNRIGHVVVHHDLAECCSRSDYKEDGGIDLDGTFKNFEKFFGVHGTHDETFGYKSIDDGNGSCFRRCSQTSVNSTQYNNGYQQCPFRIA